MLFAVLVIAMSACNEKKSKDSIIGSWIMPIKEQPGKNYIFLKVSQCIFVMADAILMPGSSSVIVYETSNVSPRPLSLAHG